VPIGPALLVQTFVFANEHLLLMKRGLDPYQGKWAPPGGFVEANESAEAAAARETWEEVRLEISVDQLLPLATVSVPAINQVHLMFLVRLPDIAPIAACAPEALDARWFPEDAFPLIDIWAPFEGIDIAEMFERIRNPRFDYYQWNDVFHRVISERETIRYIESNARKSS
jgi:ADP-ribose pyrophosphatase YjhB (NUDIX family)